MKKHAFHLDWEFRKEAAEEWKDIILPHDAMLTETRDAGCENGANTGYFPGGKYRYRKKFQIPESRDAENVILEFEGVYCNSEVFINGEKAGGHRYGYTNFYIDITDFIYTDREKYNEILVKVDNSKEPNSRWYTGSGIYRPVHLFTGGKAYIHPNKVKITAENGDIAVETNYVSSNENISVHTEILYNNELVVISNTAESGVQQLKIPHANKWSAESPNLYHCRISLLEDGEILDSHETEFGIRSISVSAREGLRINGEEVKLRGACIHHDNGILGAATYEDAEKRRIKILKEAGFNAVRAGHNPLSKAILQACDRYGLYVIDETFDQWYIPKTKYDYASIFEEDWKMDTTAMVEKDYNHPSVIMYSIGNEVSETVNERGIELTEKQADKVRELDPTRPVTIGINLFLNGFAKLGMGIYSEEKIDKKEKKDKSPKKEKKNQASGSEFINNMMTAMGSFMNNFGRLPLVDKATRDAFAKVDVAGYNYGSGRYRMESRKHPDRVIAGSETFPGDLAKNWKMVKKFPYLIGDFMWTGFDYLGEAGLGASTYPGQENSNPKPYPWLLFGGGVIDITGYQTPQAAYNKVVWGLIDRPIIAVEPVHYYPAKPVESMWRHSDGLASWSWDDCEGKKATVEVYSAAPQVELFLNGKSMGSKKAGEANKYKAVFKNIPYEKGTLTAVSKDKKGKELSKSQLESAGSSLRLQVGAERSSLQANGQDLAYIDIAFTDDQGIVKVLENRTITVEVEGPGDLIGFGSANPYTEESFLDPFQMPYRGRAQAIVRTAVNPGTIKVYITAEGCEPAEVQIAVNESWTVHKRETVLVE
ncbi:glycosyl hydrolase family 2 [Sinobaca qinghaiensis]|uniref:Glycosyl hydrolase family 2 n=1 Tax=Sinobaca qinghaiensis TaxID=342944 RepID=A0A419V090_9BACL|nr:glycoside hydrolase family 2 TIM barrel-domain containing protein [Sinobaca qinghaiensis]RKD71348.1 glycosyl hydrolase family 2 [Sinobaca qinghaiensis]